MLSPCQSACAPCVLPRLDDEEKDRAVALMRRVEAGVKASMSYCINRAVSISSDPFDLVGILVGGDKINSVNNLCRR